MTKVYNTLATFPSSSDPSKLYAVKQDENGEISCNCRGWTTKKPGQERTCKHTREVERWIANGTLTASMPAEPQMPKPADPVVAAMKTQGGNLGDLLRMLDKKGL